MIEDMTGKKAPVFSGIDQDGNKLMLNDFRGSCLVLFFYPKDDTPGCTKEACGFRDAFAKLERKGVKLLGVSPDDRKSHARFRDKYELPFPLLSDTDHTICEAYGVWVEKSMYGRKYMGVQRSTFIIGPGGKILMVFPKVKPDGHALEVLAALQVESFPSLSE